MNNVRLPSMIAIAVAAMSAPPAHASVPSVSDIFSQFNAVIFETFGSSADVEGRTVVGGDLIRGATFELIPAHAASSFSGLTVYGSATSDRNGNVNNGDGVKITGSNSVTFSLNGGGTAYVGGANSDNLNSTNGTESGHWFRPLV